MTNQLLIFAQKTLKYCPIRIYW